MFFEFTRPVYFVARINSTQIMQARLFACVAQSDNHNLFTPSKVAKITGELCFLTLNLRFLCVINI